MLDPTESLLLAAGPIGGSGTTGDGSVVMLVGFVLLALLVSFACSVMEAVLLRVSPAYIAMQQEKGRAVGNRFARLHEDIDRPLSAILSLNTVAHTVGAAGAGAEAVKIVGDGWAGVITIVLTLLILFASEIIPKTLGAVYWRSLAPFISWACIVAIYIAWPMVIISQGLTRLLSRGADRSSLNREEVYAIAGRAEEEGVLDASEAKIWRRLMGLRDVPTGTAMTKSDAVFSLPASLPVSEAVHEMERVPASRIPIFAGAGDPESKEPIGYVMRDDILLAAAKSDEPESRPIQEWKRDLPTVAATDPLPVVFERMLNGREKMLAVTDEGGRSAGIITMEDVVEALVGSDIADEADPVRPLALLLRARQYRRTPRLTLPGAVYMKDRQAP